TNQLNHVLDPLGSVLGDDLDNQPLNNYKYDEIGQLISDSLEQIASIEWKVTGKVKSINRVFTSFKPNIYFEYDAMGNRISKKVVYPNSGSYTKTFYVRDAQGNVMSVYTYKLHDPNHNNENNLYLSERNIYGSSRVGMEQVEQIIATSAPGQINLINNENPTVNHYNQLIGDKRYELSNHLGNVLEVITDRKLPVSDDQVTVDYYTADVISQNDYYPFGMLLPNRHEDAGRYKYGFQGQEKDDEVSSVEGSSYTAEFWQYDSRLARRWNIDPVVKEHESPYATFANNPIWFSDPDGADSVKIDGVDYWQVEAGDTYEIVSERTGVSIDQLKSVNEMGGGNLVPGQILSFSVRTHFVYEKLTPTIYQTTVSGLSINPNWSQLTYLGPGQKSQKNSNRYYATKKCPSCEPGNSRDEFPYASTIEGGTAAICQCTPVKEQQIQAVQLRLFYSGMSANEKFNVVPVPEDLAPSNQTEPKPALEPKPIVVPYQPLYEPDYKPVIKPPSEEEAKAAAATTTILIIVAMVLLAPIGI
ncbi:MAG: NucA/NucB deoxyribonuclease domain-containing protein, partial [Putridiphycobacter sp.]